MRRALLSVKPEFVDMIFRSDKTVELRKKIPPLAAGDELLIYASTPVMALVGAVEVLDVMRHTPRQLWRLVKAQAGVEQAFYEAYYRDHDMAFGIVLGRTRLFDQPVPLAGLRRAWPGFMPPQNYRYVNIAGQDVTSVIAARQVEPLPFDGSRPLTLSIWG